MLKVDQASVFFAARDGRIVQALDSVSLEIPDQGFTVALGASGCGKSTLLNAIAGFQPLSEGTITIDGRPVTEPGADRGVVFQRDTLLPWKSVIDNVALGLKFAGVSRRERHEQARDLLKLIGLADFAGANVYELSGGMRQRVGIARALATNPDILLMDEPFGALDSLTRETMQEQLVRIWAETGKRIFFITHSIEEALFLGTEVIVMSPRPGRIAARFTPDFIHRYRAGASARDVKSLPAFASLREEIRAIIHQFDVREAA